MSRRSSGDGCLLELGIRLVTWTIILGIVGTVGAIHIKKDIENNKISDDIYISGRENDVYVCHKDAKTGRYTLHKGDVCFLDNGQYKDAVDLGITKFNFDCGKEDMSNASYSMSKSLPSSESYDDVCSGCFSEEEIAEMEQ